MYIKDTTTVPFGAGVIIAPGDVSPGHMMLAPLSTKRIAPLSTCCHGRKNGSEQGQYNWYINAIKEYKLLIYSKDY